MSFFFHSTDLNLSVYPNDFKSVKPDGNLIKSVKTKHSQIRIIEISRDQIGVSFKVGELALVWWSMVEANKSFGK